MNEPDDDTTGSLVSTHIAGPESALIIGLLRARARDCQLRRLDFNTVIDQGIEWVYAKRLRLRDDLGYI